MSKEKFLLSVILIENWCNGGEGGTVEAKIPGRSTTGADVRVGERGAGADARLASVDYTL